MNDTPTPAILAHAPFVVARAPHWLTQASAGQRQRLRDLALATESARASLRLARETVPTPQSFALPLLRTVLDQGALRDVDPSCAVMLWNDPEGKRPAVQRTLLDAALLNFHQSDTQASAYGPGSGLFAGTDQQGRADTSRPLAMAPHDFAKRCRDLDIGGQFHALMLQHIPAKLPGRRDPVEGQMPLCWKVFDTQRKTFMAQACEARMKGSMQATGQSLLAHWALAPEQTPATPAKAYRLSLAGFPLSQVLVFCAQVPGNQTQAVVGYIPADPTGAVKEYSSAQAFTQVLGERLRDDPAFLTLISTCVPLSQRHDFLQAMNAARVPGKWLPSHVAWSTLPVTADPFVDWYRVWAQQTLADAMAIAVPTALVDHQETVERYERWVALGEQLGMTAALMVASALPGLNLIAEGIILAQTIYNVYEGVQAWREGHAQAALEHLFGAIENMAFVELGKRPEPAESNLPFANALIPVTNGEGNVRLWLPDIDDYGARRLPPPTVRPDAAGVYRHDGRAWVHMGGRLHEVEADAAATTARALHPNLQRYRPALVGNGQGSWRFAHDNPASWQGMNRLMRFGHRYDGLPEHQWQEAQRLSGITDEQLRQAHVQGQGMPALLAHVLNRRLAEHLLDTTVLDLRGDRHLHSTSAPLVETLLHLPGWPVDRPLAYETSHGPVALGADRAGTAVRLSEEALKDGRWPGTLLAQFDAATSDALLGLGTSRVPPEPAHEALGQRWAALLESRRVELVDRLSQPVPEAPADPARQALKRQFPSLPAECLDVLMRGRTSTDRAALRAGRVPAGVAELAAQALRQLRMIRACDALAQGSFSLDHERLVFGLWPRLGDWARQVCLQLREGTASGALAGQAGASEQPIWTIVRRGERYQAFDAQGRELCGLTDLESALWAALPDTVREPARAAVGDALGLRQVLLEKALDNRDALRPLLGLSQDNRRFFRLPVQTPGGSIGYELSGRPRLEEVHGLVDPYRTGLRALFPDVSEAQLTALRIQLGHGEAATHALAALNADLARLRLELDTWVARPGLPPDVAQTASRRAVADYIVRGWRRFGSTDGGEALGYGLDLAGQTVGELPALTVTLPHVTRLSLHNMGLTEVNEGFLAAFPGLDRLDLSFNNLGETPPGIARLTRLQRLTLEYTGPRSLGEVLPRLHAQQATLDYLDLTRTHLQLAPEDFVLLRQFPNLTALNLADNAITLTPSTAGAFNQFPYLEELSLSGNPLQLAPDVSDLHHLALLEAAEADLTAFPPGLLALMNREPVQLRHIDLSGNAIVELPDIADTRFIVRAREGREHPESDYHDMQLSLHGNPLSQASRDRLRNANVDYFSELSESEDTNGPDPDAWLVDCPPALEARIREERQTHEAGDFYQLLGQITETQDYLHDPAAARQRAQRLVSVWLGPADNALPGLSELRERLFSMAQDAQGTCGDGVALTLDDMEAEVAAWKTVATSQVPGDGPLRDLLVFERRLWRRALVDDHARRIVRARVARRAAIGSQPLPEGAVALPPLDSLDDIADQDLDQGLDEVEVRFYLFERLEAVLDFPFTQRRRYPTRVSGTTLQRVGVAVDNADRIEDFARWVVDRPLFRDYLERGRAADYDPVRERWQVAADYLYEASLPEESALPQWPAELDGLRHALPDVAWPEGAIARLPALTEQQLRLAYEWVTRERARALEALTLRLTRQLLGLEPAVSSEH